MEEKKFAKVGVGVMVFNDKGQLLLGLRNSDKEKASSELNGEGTWTMPGGKLEYGDNPFEGACHEVKEETDLNLLSAEVVSITSDVGEKSQFITIGFKAVDWNGILKTMEPEEIIRWEWFDLDHLPLNLYNPSKKLLENYEIYLKEKCLKYNL